MGNTKAQALDPAKGILFDDRAKVLESEFQGDEVGFCVMPDKTGYAADINFLPNVTADMVDWYFLWRGLAADNYAQINPELYISALTMQHQKALDEDLTIQERLWDSTQTIVQKGQRGPTIYYLNYKNPGLAGFDMDKIGTDVCKSLICACYYEEGEPPVSGPDYFICHQIVEKDGGVEVRTKIWYGWVMRYGKAFKSLDDFVMQPLVVKEALEKNSAAWAKLADKLPQLYKNNN